MIQSPDTNISFRNYIENQESLSAFFPPLLSYQKRDDSEAGDGKDGDRCHKEKRTKRPTSVRSPNFCTVLLIRSPIFCSGFLMKGCSSSSAGLEGFMAAICILISRAAELNSGFLATKSVSQRSS